MNTARNILKWTVIVTVCLSSVCFTFLVSRKPWIGPPVPGVRLTPSRPLLRPEDVKSDMPFVMMEKGVADLEKLGAFPTNCIGDIDYLEGFVKGTNGLTDLPQTRIRYATGLSLIEQAVSTPERRHMPFTLPPELSGPYAYACGRADGLLRDLEVCEWQAGNYDAEIRDLLTTLRLSDALTRSCDVGRWMGGRFWLSIASDDLFRLSASTISRKSYEDMAQQLEEIEGGLESCEEALRYEATYTPHDARAIQAGPLANQLEMGETNYLPYVLTAWVRWRVNSAQTERHVESLYSHLIAACATNVWVVGAIPGSRLKADLTNMLIPWQLVEYSDPGGLSMAKTIVSELNFSYRYSFDTLSRLRALRVAFAIGQYKQTHGVPPASLTNLVPDLLQRIPEDPFRPGYPLVYRTESNGNWTVYSVAENGVDDAGVGYDNPVAVDGWLDQVFRSSNFLPPPTNGLAILGP